MARKPKKAGTSGDAVNYITRNQALKRLQLSLSDFRRLCILKGVYPRDPKKKAKGKDKTYYARKDILFLLHEPVLAKIRDIRAHERKITKAQAKKDVFRVKQLRESKPFYLLDHLVKERFPTFKDAVRDMDDALSMATLFANLPSTSLIEAKRTVNCRRLLLEFSNYVVKSSALRKVFLSIKGCYFQARIEGEEVTWLVPYEFGQDLPDDVDYRVMMTFLEFYETQLHFINYRLYGTLGLKYPPKLDPKLHGAHAGLCAIVVERKGDRAEEGSGDPEKPVGKKNKAKIKSLKQKFDKLEQGAGAEKAGAEGAEELEQDLAANAGLQEAESDEEMEQEGDDSNKLFKGMRFFIGREVSKSLFEFMLKSFGAEVGWEGEGSPFGLTSERITHQLVDRNAVPQKFSNREYVQPQWVADCINAELLLPIEPYGLGKVPPPHLSPFVDDEEEGYMPDQRKVILELKAQAEGHAGAFDNEDEGEEDEEDEEGEDADGPEVADEEMQYEKELAAEQNAAEGDEGAEGTGAEAAGGKRKKSKKEVEVERQRMMMPKKDRRLYDKIMFAKERKAQKVQKLMSRKTS